MITCPIVPIWKTILIQGDTEAFAHKESRYYNIFILKPNIMKIVSRLKINDWISIVW